MSNRKQPARPGMRRAATRMQTMIRHGFRRAFAASLPFPLLSPCIWRLLFVALLAVVLPALTLPAVPAARGEASGKGVSPGDKPQAVEARMQTMTPAERQRVVLSAARLGARYEAGRKLPLDVNAAETWFTFAARHLPALAEGGNAEAAYRLADLYAQGKGGLPIDEGKASHWFHRSAEGGYVEGQFMVAIMYLKGIFVRPDGAKALPLLRQAAEQGHARAQYGLGVVYYQGKLAPQDDDQALQWWRKAAAQGEASSLYNMGMMAWFGRGGPQNHQEAVRWWLKAAEKKHALAYYFLGIAYQRGKGAPLDKARAIEWYRKAGAAGVPQAAKRVRELGGKQ